MHFYYTLSSSLGLTPGVADLWKWFRLGNTNSFKNDSGNFMGERAIMAYSGKLECSLTFLAFQSDIRINNHAGWFLRPLPVFSCASLCSHQMLSGATVKLRAKPARLRQSLMCCSLRGGGKGSGVK